MPCFQPIRWSQNPGPGCRDQNPSCPVPPHNLSYCKDWSDRITDVKFWQSTTSADFPPPKARSVPNLLPCLDGRIFTRTEIGEPKGTALTSLYKISTSHRDYRPPVGLSKKYPSTEGFREPWRTVLCRWCGNTKPSQQCSAECGRIERPREHRLPIHNVIGMYTDCSRENDPTCSPCLQENQLVPVNASNEIPEDRYGSVCPPQRNCKYPVRTPAWGESVTRYDFKSPHSPGVRAKRAEKLSYYQRFMDDMCTSSHILDRVAEFGTLGGSITQYQSDFGMRLPSEDLQNRYRILVGCPPLTGNNVLSPYSTCGKQCNV